MNKRRYQRVKVVNCFADLANEVGFFSGTVSNISRNGMLLDDVPQKLNNSSRKLTIVVSLDGRNFKLLAIPKWVCENHRSKSIGIEILNAPSGWCDYVKQREPKEIVDQVWAAVSLRN